MNKALLMVAAAGMSAIAASAVVASAWAQPAPPPQPPQQAQPGGPPPGMGPQARGPGFPPGPPPGEEGHPGMFGHRGWRHGPPPSRAASFHVQRGDISVGVRCAQDEPTRACVDAAIALMDKANSLTAP